MCKSPFEILDPEKRWFPADESLRERTYEKLLPPLVANLRKAVKKWRFQPGSMSGKPVEMKVLVPVHFLLQKQ